MSSDDLRLYQRRKRSVSDYRRPERETERTTHLLHLFPRWIPRIDHAKVIVEGRDTEVSVENPLSKEGFEQKIHEEARSVSSGIFIRNVEEFKERSEGVDSVFDLLSDDLGNIPRDERTCRFILLELESLPGVEVAEEHLLGHLELSSKAWVLLSMPFEGLSCDSFRIENRLRRRVGFWIRELKGSDVLELRSVVLLGSGDVESLQSFYDLLLEAKLRSRQPVQNQHVDEDCLRGISLSDPDETRVISGRSGRG